MIGGLRVNARRATRAVLYASHIKKVVNGIRFAQEKDVCFVWVPKTAGTSIYRWLRLELGMLLLKEMSAIRGEFPGIGPVTFGHVSYGLLLQTGAVTPQFQSSAFKFSFIRNPYDRAVSLYLYLTTRSRVSGTFTQFLETVYRGIEPVGLYNSAGLSQCNPQVRWLFDDEGKLLVDRIYRLEFIDQAVDEVASKLGIRSAKIHANRSQRPPWVHTLYEDQRNVELVRHIYREDFDLLGYDAGISVGHRRPDCGAEQHSDFGAENGKPLASPRDVTM